MAGIQARSNTFFRVGPAELAKPEYFAVKRGELGVRSDPYFYRSTFRQLVKNLIAVGSKPLGSLVKFSDETWDNSDGRFVSTFPYIEISGVGLGTNEYHVFETLVSEAPSRARQVVRTDDILISLTRPHRGAIARVLPEHDGAIASTGFAIARDMEHSQIHRDYLLLCLASRFGSHQMLMRSSGGNYPAITKEELSKVLIPYIGLESQQTLISAMASFRTERNTKLAEADALLAGLDDFLLEALRIETPPEDSRRVFAVKQGQSRSQGRLNSDYYHPDRTRALRSLNAASQNLPVTSLAAVASFERNQLGTPGENYLSLAHVQSHTGELAYVTATATGNCFTYRAEDVLFARLRPYLNKVYWAEMDGCCSTEFHVLRVKHRETLIPAYLATILRSRIVLAQTVHMMTGNTHPRLTNDDVANLQIAIPRMEIQETIAAEVVRRREEARRLRSDAKTGWREAKQWFEGQLLGPITS